MLSLNDLRSQLDEALAINSSESSFSLEYYTDLINEQRSLFIRNEYNKNRTIDPYIIQDINCLELEPTTSIECCDSIPMGCSLLRTVKQIPNTIEFFYSKGITSVGSPDITVPRINLIDFSRINYIGFGRTTSSKVYAFLYMKRIYLISRDPSFMIQRRISIRGIFEDPTSLSEFNNCSDEPCWTPNTQYPLNQWMWSYMKPYIVQQLLQKIQLSNDDSNNMKDDKIDNING